MIHKDKKTFLPASYGEATELPGISNSSCVASVVYLPEHPSGVSATITASSHEVYVLGPNMERPMTQATRRLWRPSSYSTSSHSPSPVGSCEDAVSLVSRSKDGWATRMVSLTAFLLYPSRSHARTCGNALSTPVASSCFPPDAVCIAVGWEDPKGGHHVSLVVISLIAALTPSCRGDAVLLRQLEVLVLPPDKCLLRVFYVPESCCALVPQVDQGEPLHDTNRGPEEQKVGRSSELHIGAKHVLLLSTCLRPSASSPSSSSGTAQPFASTIGGGPVLSQASPAMPAASTSRTGGLLFMAIREGAPPLSADHDACGVDVITLSPAAAAVERNGGAAVPRPAFSVWAVGQSGTIAHWLWNFKPDSVICCLDVLPRSWLDGDTAAGVKAEGSSKGRIRAAAGSTSGRVYLLREGSFALVRRVAGPVADVKFVVPSLSSSDRRRPRGIERSCGDSSGVGSSRGASPQSVQFRIPQVDALIAAASPSKKRRMKLLPSASTPACNGDAWSTRPQQEVDLSLVILDTAGKVLIMRRVNTSKPVVQMVSDVPRVVTMSEGTTAAVNASRHHQAPSTHRGGPDADLVSGDRGYPLPSASLLAKKGTALLQKDDEMGNNNNNNNNNNSNPSAHEHLAGHVLSSGLLHAAVRYHPLQLIVSTMGQGIVVIPFHVSQDRFAIASYTLCPSPVFYIGVVDYFRTGAEDLVMAGPDSVLIARQPQKTQCKNVAALLRLLRSRGGLKDK